jgi:hypothetical protein
LTDSVPHADGLFARCEERTALRHYLIGLLLPREHNKTVVELAAIVPGANRQSLHHFMHDALLETRRHSIGAGCSSGKRTPIWVRMPAACSSWTRRGIPNAAIVSP